ncbi:MAG TPA: transposase, partial [Ilumatobacteraceae bacterium]
TTSQLFADKCIAGIEPNTARLEELAESNLQVATALNPHIGYDAATTIVKEAAASGRSVREVAREHGVREEVLDEALDLHRMTRGG